MQRPKIGITPDHCTEKTYSKYSDWYALRTNHCTVISEAGGTPMLLPYDLQAIDEYVAFCDGFVIPGGDFDIPPEAYGESPSPKLRNAKNLRTQFETALLQQILDSRKPLISICAGMQLLNVIQGGTLVQDLGEKNAVHEQPNPHNTAAHDVHIKPGSLLHKICQLETVGVNSTHHQAVAKPGRDLVVTATSTDEVIEAIELQTHPFVIGLEWHPEFCLNTLDQALWHEFIQHC